MQPFWLNGKMAKIMTTMTGWLAFSVAVALGCSGNNVDAAKAADGGAAASDDAAAAGSVRTDGDVKSPTDSAATVLGSTDAARATDASMGTTAGDAADGVEGTAGGDGGFGTVSGGCSPHDPTSPTHTPTVVSASACEEVFLSDICPVAEYNVHHCVTFDTVYWQPDMVMDGVVYRKGIGTHAPDPAGTPDASCRFYSAQSLDQRLGRAAWDLHGYDRFSATIGLAEAAGQEPTTYSDGVVFRIYVDGVAHFDSGVVLFSTSPIVVSFDVSAGSLLELEVDAIGGNWADHAVWANARLRRSCSTSH